MRAQAVVQRGDKCPEDGDRDARAALRHAGDAREHRGAHAVVRQRRSDADGAGPHRVHLVALLLVGGKRSAGVGAESGVEPVDRRVADRRTVDDRARALESCDDVGSNVDRRAIARDGDDVRDPDAGGAQRDGAHRRARGRSRFYLTTPLDFRKSWATSLGSIFSPSTL